MLPDHVALIDEILPIRLDADKNFLQSDELQSPSLTPLVGIISCESDLDLKKQVGEATSMQGVKNSMKWKRRARELAGKINFDNQSSNSILGHKRESGVSFEDNSRQESRTGKRHVVDELETPLKDPF